jgi:hypothetical protein
MNRRIRLALALGSALVAIACSSGDGDGSSSGGGPGSACSDGAACADGLVCVIADDDPESGSCTAEPAACKSDESCGCMAELYTHCTSGGSCIGHLRSYTVGCNTSTLRQKGETCSALRGCSAGLYCHQPNAAASAGSCKDLPGECGGSASCDCLAPIKDACSTNFKSCSVLGDEAIVSCF